MPLVMDLPMTADAGPVLTAAQQFWQLPSPELHGLLALTGQADRIELKLVVPTAEQKATCSSLGVSFPRASARKVYFLDTPDLLLERHGVVARIRSNNKGADDSVIKLRPCAPEDLPARLRRAKSFTLEVDAMPGQYVCTGAMSRRLGKHDVERTVAKGRPLRTLFSKEQLSLLPNEVSIDDLAIFGPVEVRRGKVVPARRSPRLTVERWTYPDGSRIVELSTRSAAADAVPVAARLTSVLRKHQVDVTGRQVTKTHATLAYFHERH